MQKQTDHYTGTGNIRRVAAGERLRAGTINDLIEGQRRILREDEPEQPITSAAESWTLQHSKPANNQCKISAGTVTIAHQNYSVAETTVTLTGASEFVFVKLVLSSGATSVLHASTRPVSDSTNFYLILASFTATDGVYDAGTIHWRGDYNANALLT